MIVPQYPENTRSWRIYFLVGPHVLCERDVTC